MANFLVKISYNGTMFYGFQRQPKYKNTVQEEVETLLSKLLNEKVTIFGAGRTDKGVHALNQCFNFHTSKKINTQKLMYAFNRLIGPYINMNEIKEVSEDFHARYYAKTKIYKYRINQGNKDPFNEKTIYQLNRKLDLDKMIEASKLFLGEHNFKNFTTKEEDTKGYIRNIKDIIIEGNNDIVDITFIADGFMRYMVRMIVGTLIKIGLNKIKRDNIKNLLDNPSSVGGVYKAPAEGLYLVDVLY